MIIQPMKLSDMVESIGQMVDDVLDTTLACRWLNAGQNKMAIAVGASFPQLDPTNPESAFVFDAKWQEIPILYACAVYKGMDTSLQEKNSFMSQFLDGVKDFVSKYEVPIQYKDDMYSQQFVATAGQTDFTITKSSYDEDTADLKIYVNNSPVTHTVDQGIILLDTAVNAGDYVTAIWEIHTDLDEPPYSFWGW